MVCDNNENDCKLQLKSKECFQDYTFIPSSSAMFQWPTLNHRVELSCSLVNHS